jgi:eukaryotic-like serine/threonine-protein kinase
MSQNPLTDRSIFLAAIDIASPAEREAYVARACEENPQLRAEVQALLAAHGQSGDLLDAPDRAAMTIDQSAERPGTQIGPYKLLQQIGEGGMGVVYMAEQTEPVQRKVALKLIKPGMDSRQIIARFEAERQALAMMDHVNIARVLDAGTIPIADLGLQNADCKSEISNLQSAISPGRPYFVMELVHGVPITKYCDDNRLTPRQRLELFVPVCQAIQHAHQKGIIHRDIKPSNVMVTLYDGKPVPKVIDFGVAKATEQKLTERTLFTQYGTMVGTLEYMSPEQAEMSALGVDTRSDIYSLGVLLYELLTGSTPLSSKRMKEAAYAEILRLIKEEEPPKPSTRLSDSGEALASISAQRHTEPAKLSKLMRGELDWIVMKTLEKDRNRRYETANAFAADVQRYLNDEPVQACPPSAMYRFRKFARRNKAAIGVAGMVLFFLVLLGSGAGWALRDREAREQEIAQQTARKLALTEEGIRQALDRGTASRADLHVILKKPGGVQQLLNQPARWKLLIKTAQGELAQARQLAVRDEGSLDNESTQAMDQLEQQLTSDQADYDLALRLEKIRLDTATWVEGGFAYLTADEYSKAFAGFALLTDDPAAAAARLGSSPIKDQLVAALDHWALIASKSPQKGLAEQLLALARQAAPDPAWGDRLRQLKVWYDQESLDKLVAEAPIAGLSPQLLLVVGSKLSDVGRKESWLRQAQAEHPADFWLNYTLARELAKTNPVEAAGFYRVALAVRPGNSSVYNNLGTTLLNQKKLPEAVAAFRKATENAPKQAFFYSNLGFALHQQGKLDEAIVCCCKAIELDPKFANAYNILGLSLHDQGKVDDAIASYRKAIELNPKFADAHSNLGTVLSDQKKPDEAIACYHKAIELDPKHVNAHINLGNVFYHQNKLDEAIGWYRKALKIDAKHAGTHYSVGVTLKVQRKLEEAIACLRKAIELDPKHPHAHNALGGTLQAQGKVDEAIACYRKAIEVDPKSAAAHYSLAWQLTVCYDLKLRDPKQALVSARLAVQLEPKNATYCQGLGYADYRAGNWKAAITALEKLKELGSPGDSMEWFPLAMAYWQLGDKDAARKTYDQAVQWMEKNKPKDKFLRSLQAEAAELMGIELKKE